MGLIDPIFWKWLIPEIAFFPARLDRVRVWRRAVGRSITARQWMPFAIPAIAVMCFAIGYWSPAFMGEPLIYIPVWVTVPPFAFVLLWRRKLRATVRECLREVNRCDYCGYDLRGSMSDKCPECGKDWKPPRTLVSIDQAMLMD